MALNTPYKRVDLNVNPNYAAMAQKDPWFALGYALGEGYWNNYNERGEKKATETAEQMLNSMAKTGDPNAGILTNDDLISKYARPDKKQQILDTAINLPEIKYDKDGKEVKGSGNQQPTIDHSLLKWGYLNDKYADNPNPASDSVAAQKLVNGVEIALNNADMGTFDAEKFKLALDKQLMADGRNARQREAAWAAIQPMIAEKKTQYNNQVIGQLYDAYKLAYADGNYNLAEQYAIQMSKFDSNLSKYLLAKERDRYQSELADERADKAYLRKLGLAGRTKENASIYESPQYKNAMETDKRYRAAVAEGHTLTDAEAKDWYNVQTWLHKVNEGGYATEWRPNLANKEDVMEVVRAGQKGGKSNADILAWAKQYYDNKTMPPEIYNSLVEELSPKKEKAKTKPKEEKTQQEQWSEYAERIAKENAANPDNWRNPWTGALYAANPWFGKE